jgi:uncharacterized protein (TIGR02147 family)
MFESTEENYRDILNEYFLIRRESNPNYSLRAFASDLDIPSSNLSCVLNGKQGLSEKSASQITEKLNITGEERSHFVDLVLATDARSKKEKILARGRLRGYQQSSKKSLQEDYFKLISEHYYYTILELLTLSQFQSDHKWIAAQLGVDKKTVDTAMARLVRLNLVECKDKQYISTGVQLDTTFDIPSYFIKKHNVQILNKAKDSLLEQSVDIRETSTLTIAMNVDDLGYVKKRIREFRNDIDKELMLRSKKKGANRVYNLAIQFFDLLKGNYDEDI